MLFPWTCNITCLPKTNVPQSSKCCKTGNHGLNLAKFTKFAKQEKKLSLWISNPTASSRWEEPTAKNGILLLTICISNNPCFSRCTVAEEASSIRQTAVEFDRFIERNESKHLVTEPSSDFLTFQESGLSNSLLHAKRGYISGSSHPTKIYHDPNNTYLVHQLMNICLLTDAEKSVYVYIKKYLSPSLQKMLC